MHRIIEAFTRPHYQVTAIDELIMFGVVMLVLITVIVIAGTIMKDK